jgi:hypothetical protein
MADGRLQKCEFVESPQAAVPPPAPPVQIVPPQHTCFATGRLGIFSETAASLVISAVDPNQPVTVLGVSPARDWVLISTLATGQRGWVDARYPGLARWSGSRSEQPILARFFAPRLF